MAKSDKRAAVVESHNLVHEYSRRDEEGNITGIVRALDGVDIQVKQGILWRFWEQTVLENPHLQSI